MANQTVAELKKKADAAWGNLSRQLEGMEPHIDRSIAPGEWTTREVLCHLLFEPGFEPGDEAWPHGPRQHHEIVGIPHQARIGELGGAVRPVEGAVEVVEIDVGQERRDHPTLRRSLPRAREARPPGLVFLHHRAPQPQPNEPQHRAVDNAPLELLHQPVVVNGVEVARQVRVVHRRPTGRQRRLHMVERLVRVPPRTEPEGAPLEVRFEDRFDHQEHRHLGDAVSDGRNAPRAEPPIGFRDVDTANRLRAIRPRPQGRLQVGEERGHPARLGLDGLERHAINTRRAPIGPHPLPRRLEHVGPGDAV